MTKEQLEAFKAWVLALVDEKIGDHEGSYHDPSSVWSTRTRREAEDALDALFAAPEADTPDIREASRWRAQAIGGGEFGIVNQFDDRYCEEDKVTGDVVPWHTFDGRLAATIARELNRQK